MPQHVTEKTVCREIAVKYGKRTIKAEVTGDPAGIAKFLRKILPTDGREYFVVVGVDARNAPLWWHVASVGTLSATLVHPREIFRFAVIHATATIAVAHCHPSGDPSPSKDDDAVTERIHSAGKILGIPLLDHIILGDESSYSYRVSKPHLLR